MTTGRWYPKLLGYRKLLPKEAQSLIVAGALISITLNPAVFFLVHRFQSGRQTTQAS